jgi:hypothetical protein
VTTGETNEGEIIEAQVDELIATTGAEISVVTADARYAYAKVHGGLERRGIDPLIPAKAEPIKSRDPPRRYSYDPLHVLRVIRHDVRARGLRVRIFMDSLYLQPHFRMETLRGGAVNGAVRLGGFHAGCRVYSARFRGHWADGRLRARPAPALGGAFDE